MKNSQMDELGKVQDEEIGYIIQLLSNIYPVDKSVKRALYKHAFSLHLKNEDILYEQGVLCRYLYFVKKGSLMSYYPVKNKRIITYIAIENEFVGSISGLYGITPTKEAIVAIEDAYLIGINMDIILKLLESSFSLNYIFRVMFEQYYKDAEERAYLVRVGNAKERYLYYKQTRPTMFERLSVDYIAALLSMKPETLIKIRENEENSEKRIKEGDQILKKLNKLIMENNLFKDPTIKVSVLANLIDMQSYKLSSVLNQTCQMNFNTFINQYRVNYMKTILKETDSMENYTIDGLAQEAGFPSRSTFYKVFKKETGLSAIEYTKLQKKNK